MRSSASRSALSLMGAGIFGGMIQLGAIGVAKAHAGLQLEVNVGISIAGEKATVLLYITIAGV